MKSVLHFSVWSWASLAEVEIRKEDVDKSTSDNLHSSVLQFLLKHADIRLQQFADPFLKLSSEEKTNYTQSGVLYVMIA